MFFWKRSIGGLEKRRKIGALIKILLRDSDESRVAQAAEALGRLNAGEAVPALIECHGRYFGHVRSACVQVLAQLRDPRAIPVFECDVKSSSLDPYRSAVSGLVKLGTAQAVIKLLEATWSRGEAGRGYDRSDYEALHQALREVQQKEVGIKWLLPRLTNLETCRSAASFLDDLGWQPTSDEGGAWYWASKRRWDKCIQLGRYAVKPLCELIRRTPYNGDLEQEAIELAEALGAIGHQEAVGSLVYVFDVGYYPVSDPWEGCRTYRHFRIAPAIANALGQIGGPKATKALVSALLDEHEYEEVRFSTVQPLGRIGTPEAVGALESVAAGHTSKVQAAAAKAVQALKNARGIDHRLQ